MFVKVQFLGYKFGLEGSTYRLYTQENTVSAEALGIYSNIENCDIRDISFFTRRANCKIYQFFLY